MTLKRIETLLDRTRTWPAVPMTALLLGSWALWHMIGAVVAAVVCIIAFVALFAYRRHLEQLRLQLIAQAESCTTS